MQTPPGVPEAPRLLREGIPRSVAVWLLTLLAALLALLLWVGVRDISAPDPGPLVAMRSDAGPQGLRIVQVAGASVPLEDVLLIVVVDNRSEQVPLSEAAPGLGPTWDPGERVCIVGPDPGCLHHAGASAEVRVVVAGLLLHEARVSLDPFGAPPPALPAGTGLPRVSLPPAPAR